MDDGQRRMTARFVRDPEDGRRIAELERKVEELEAALAETKRRRLDGDAGAKCDDAARAEEAPLASEAKFQAIANSIDQMIWSTRPDGFHDYYNDRWYEFTGVPYGSTDGEGWNGMFHPQDQERAWAVWRRCLETGEPYHIEYRLRHRSGRYRWVIGRAQCVRDAEDRIARWYGTCTDVHDLKVAQAELLRANALLGAVMEAVPGVVYAKDCDGRMLIANRGTAELVGKPLAAIVGRTDLEFLDDKREAEAVMANDRRIMEQGRTQAIEEAVSGPDGTHLVWFSTKAPLRGADGAVIGVVGASVDITERKRAEEALRAREAELTEAQRLGHIGSWHWDARNDVISGSDELLRVFGLDPARDAMPGFHEQSGTLFPPESWQRLNASVSEALRSGIGYELDVEAFRNGAPIWITTRSEVVRDAEGRAVGLRGTVQDITERKEAEEALRESEARFQLLAEAIGEVFYLSDVEARKILYVSPAYERLWGRPAAELYADVEAYVASIRPDDRAAAAAALARQAAGEPTEIEYRISRPDGSERCILDRSYPVTRAGRRLAAGLAEDVTARRAEEARRLAFVELADRFREGGDTADLSFAAAEIMGRTLRTSRAGYGTIDPDAETITIEQDWTAPGIESLAGVLRFRDYGSYVEDLKRGETVVFADAELDPRTSADAEALKAIGARSAVNMPVREQGRLVAVLYLSNTGRRDWSQSELAFIREVAERTRTAVERRRAEQELR